MNKIVKGKQCTIIWHIEDPKMLHADPNIASSVISDIETEYGNISKMNITRGKIHKYLGMTINYYSPVKIKFSMVNYIVMMIDDIPEDIRGESATLAINHIFDMAEDTTKLSWTNADLFYHFVEQILYLLNQARPCIDLLVSFWCTRVIYTDTD